MDAWTVLFDYPSGRAIGLRSRPDDQTYYALVRLDTDGPGTVWRDADDEVVAYDVPVDVRSHQVEGRPSLVLPVGLLSLQHPQHRYLHWTGGQQESPDEATGRTYDVRDLVRAYLELDRWHDAPRRRWARRRYEALARGLGIAGRGPADQPADPGSLVDGFVEGIRDRYRATRSPFDGLMEAPEAVIEAYQRCSKDLDRSVQELRESLVSVLAVLVAAGWHVDREASVTHEQLVEWGWDLDEPRPDPVDDDW